MKRAAARAVGGQVELRLELHERVRFAFRLPARPALVFAGAVADAIGATLKNPGRRHG